MEQQPVLLKRGEVLERLNISEFTLRQLVRRGELAPLKLPTGGSRYLGGEIDALLERMLSARAGAEESGHVQA